MLESGSEHSWVSALSFIEFYRNSTVLKTIGESHFYVIYGILPASPIDRIDDLYHIHIDYICFVDHVYNNIESAKNCTAHAQVW